MNVSEVTAFIWDAISLLISSTLFWSLIIGALLAGYLLALAVSRLSLKNAQDPRDAASTGFVWGFWLALLLCCGIMYFFWPLAYVAVAAAIALLLVVGVPMIVLAILKSRNRGLEV